MHESVKVRLWGIVLNVSVDWQRSESLARLEAILGEEPSKYTVPFYGRSQNRLKQHR